jgi:hypothetical protein
LLLCNTDSINCISLHLLSCDTSMCLSCSVNNLSLKFTFCLVTSVITVGMDCVGKFYFLALKFLVPNKIIFIPFLVNFSEAYIAYKSNNAFLICGVYNMDYQYTTNVSEVSDNIVFL